MPSAGLGRRRVSLWALDASLRWHDDEGVSASGMAGRFLTRMVLGPSAPLCCAQGDSGVERLVLADAVGQAAHWMPAYAGKTVGYRCFGGAQFCWFDTGSVTTWGSAVVPVRVIG
jgi:hypothetical protein